MRIRLLGEAHVREAVDMAGAVAAMGEAFRAISSGDAQVPLRAGLDTRHGVHLFMPAHVASTEATGVKVVSVCPGNASLGIPAIHAVVMVLEAATGRPLALMDGTYLTALRTGAASGFATGLLARESAGVVALFGAGVQARTQLEAVRCVRPVREVRVMSRRGESAERLVAELRGTGGETAVVARAVEHPREALAGADIVIAATDSATPVFPGDGVEEGAHVNGVGSYTPAMQEVDADLVARARVFVDQREAALAEAG
ncbi:MAG: ornithine cyclodeaminase family protein, partial [Gemmatimonadota bacterium]|nr:ornithine cyclodeaminase family protein [Gemmatimonadota bacterium]